MTAGPRTNRRRLISIGVVVTAFVIGAVLARVGAPDGTDASRTNRAHSTPDRSADAPQPTDARSGEDGAVTAALAYTEASQRWLYLPDEQIRTAIAAIAEPGAADRIAADVVADVARARAGLAGSDGAVWWIVRPLAWRSQRTSADLVRVEVWAITVLSATGVAAPQSEYMTVRLDLRRVGGRWLLGAVGDEPGPTPVTGPHDQPWDAERFGDALSGFTRVGEEEEGS